MASFKLPAIFRRVEILSMIVLVIAYCDVASSTILDSTALLNLKKSFTGNNNALVSWKPGPDPCSSVPSLWAGIVCDNRGSVIGIRLENIGLSGIIDVNSLLKVRSLRTVSFGNNSFSGPIPAFNRLVGLKILELARNRFSGSIPQDFFNNMPGLRNLWLSYNNFAGEIPRSVANLKHLEELHLENNGFSGNIPPMDLPVLEILNFSNNKLQGEIPKSLSRFGLNPFIGNPGLCGPHTPLLCNSNSNSNSNNLSEASPAGGASGDNNENKPQKLKLGIMTVGVLVLSALGFGTIFSKYKQQHADGKSNSNGLPFTMQDSNSWSQKKIGARGVSLKGDGVDNLVLVNQDKGVFGMLDLMRAGAEVMGHGLLGSSYKAMLGNGLKMVVKRVKDMSRVEKEEFDDEMTRLGSLRHPNLLPLLGYQYRPEEKLLVSEFVNQGNLTCFLNDDAAKFDWPARLKVVKGIARGLVYLQSEVKSSSDLPHGNLKSSNVLIGPEFEPLLVDYCFNPLMKPEQASKALSSYKSPEASETQKVSSKSDVYCLGIIILEILTGKTLSQNDQIDDIITAITENREQDVLDSELVNMNNNSMGEITKLFMIGVNCTKLDPDQRLEIDEANEKISNVQVEGEDFQQQAHTITVKEEHKESEQEQFQ